MKRYFLERMLELNDAGVKNRWIEREEKLCVVSINSRLIQQSTRTVLYYYFSSLVFSLVVFGSVVCQARDTRRSDLQINPCLWSYRRKLELTSRPAIRLGVLET